MPALSDHPCAVDIFSERRLSYHMAQASHDSLEKTFAVPSVIPIFPLPDVVFFPQTFLPLHIFEPRYRQMVKEAEQKGQCIGMALLKDGWEHDYDGSPPIHARGCVGRLLSVHSLPDGRFNIILEGLQRFEITEECHSVPFRQARIHLCQADDAACLPNELRVALLEKTESYLTARNAQDLCRLLHSSRMTDGILVNSLSSCLDFSPVEKQLLLESDSLAQQARRLIDLLQFNLHKPSDMIGQG